MASTQGAELQVVSEAPTGFKRRQSTMVMAGMYYLISLLIFGVCVGLVLWTGEWINMWRIVMVPIFFVCGLVWLEYILSINMDTAFYNYPFEYTQCFHYCDVEDLGDRLKVTFGPLAMPCEGTTVEVCLDSVHYLLRCT